MEVAEYTRPSECATAANFEDCLTAAAMSNNLMWNLIRVFQCLLSFGTLLLLAILIPQFKRSRMPFHANLLCLIVNIVVLFIAHSLVMIFQQARALSFFLMYNDPCTYLTPVWMGVFIRLFSYIYMIGFALLHLGVTVERARATIFVKNYERQGKKCSLVGVVIVWLITGTICGAVVVSALQDELFSKPLVFLTLITKDNQQGLIYMHYAILVLLAATSTSDYLIILANRRSQNKIFEYTLSRSYQLNENIITMRLILPLDVSYALLFFTYVALGTYLRSIRDQISAMAFFSAYDLNNCLLMIHSLTTCLFYWRFSRDKHRKRMVEIKPVNQHADLYFTHLNTMWV